MLGGFTCASFLFWESQCGGELGQLSSTVMSSAESRGQHEDILANVIIVTPW